MSLPTCLVAKKDKLSDEGRPAYVYIVRCADNTLYTGWTFDVPRRLAEHNAGRGARYTRQRRPVELVYWERQPSRSAAMQRENEIKRRGRPYKERLTAAIAGKPDGCFR